MEEDDTDKAKALPKSDRALVNKVRKRLAAAQSIQHESANSLVTLKDEFKLLKRQQQALQREQESRIAALEK